MTENLDRFGMGARFVPADKLSEANLGPLQQLVGEWETVGNLTFTEKDESGAEVTKPVAAGWNTISVPGGGGFIFEVIPYKENLKFSAVAVQAGNRGPVINGTQFDQEIFGLFYEQQVISVCNTTECVSMGFGAGKVIHAETGLFLYITNYNGNFTIARLGTVPHGNALLALGKSFDVADPVFEPISTLPTLIGGGQVSRLGYNEQITLYKNFKEFDKVNPNSFLETSLAQVLGQDKLTGVTVLDMATNHADATGGILNIPFIQSNVTATNLKATFWLETINNSPQADFLQYSQTVNLVFPAVNTIDPVVWPHITIATLKRMPPKPAPVPKQAENTNDLAQPATAQPVSPAAEPEGKAFSADLDSTPGVPQL
ncbi:heme-binding protein [Hufsiella ginkgonis]|uniref:Uncharacterized protein n=1 Tax=Hufsiella ginkgonis TaxID=2695274 RepID=A0A7K1XTP6_9SPHI|nr:heme-binding protein [Hufsiella ginkgonis]MXV13886.1 hypothetical protein [Hufsiella ginkgonis]